MEITIYGRVQTEPIDYKDIPMAFWPARTLVMLPDGRKIGGPVRDRISAVCRSMADCDDLVAWFGGHGDFCPDLPVLVMIPGNPKVITGEGFATASELRDCATELWGIYAGSDAHKRFNNDEIREQLGLARREDVQEMTREAFWERTQRHRKSPVTDPVKQFQYPNPTGRTMHKTAEDQSWKRN